MRAGAEVATRYVSSFSILSAAAVTTLSAPRPNGEPALVRAARSDRSRTVAGVSYPIWDVHRSDPWGCERVRRM